jgi:hypothetical protein
MAVSLSAAVSWKSRAWVDPSFLHGDEEDPQPFLLINPALERIFLRQVRGDWRPHLPDGFAAAGLQKVGQVVIDLPVSGLAGRLEGGMLTVRLLGPPFEAYITRVDGPFIRRARELGYVVLCITHVVNPSEQLSGEDMVTLMHSKAVLLGAVALRP